MDASRAHARGNFLRFKYCRTEQRIDVKPQFQYVINLEVDADRPDVCVPSA